MPAQNKETKSDADALRRVETFYAGRRMLEAESDAPVTARRVIWRLLQEAAQTERAIRRPGPAAAHTAMPEVVHTAGEIFATEVEMAKDEITYTPHIHETPSAAALTRYCEVMGWLRYIRGRNVARSRRAVLLLSAGVPEARVMDIFGFRSRQAVDGVRYRAISGILERLKRDLPADAVR